MSVELPTRLYTVIRVTWKDEPATGSDVFTLAPGKRSHLLGWENPAGVWGSRALAEEISGYEILARPTLATRIRGRA